MNEKKLANNDIRLVLSQRARDNAALHRGHPMIMWVVKKRWEEGVPKMPMSRESIHVVIECPLCELESLSLHRTSITDGD